MFAGKCDDSLFLSLSILIQTNNCNAMGSVGTIAKTHRIYLFIAWTKHLLLSNYTYAMHRLWIQFANFLSAYATTTARLLDCDEK